MTSVLILGQGYTGSFFKQAFLDRNPKGHIVGTTQNGRHSTLPFSHTCPLNISVWQHATHILISIPPLHHTDWVADVYGSMLLDLPHLKWVGYLSSTSVYGDHQGAWVTEESETKATTTQGKERLQAEAAWQKLAEQGLPVTIFRLAGIYGPHRSVITSLKQGKTSCPYVEDVVFSRIHVKDIAHILLYALDHPSFGDIYNVADDMPASSLDVMCYGAQILGLKRPEAISLEEAFLSDRGKSFYQDSKKVSNQKLKNWLKKPLIYPTYQAGLNSFM